MVLMILSLIDVCRQRSCAILEVGEERLVVGAVVDFLNTSCCGIDNPFAFNVADIGIVAGAVGLLIFADAPNNET